MTIAEVAATLIGLMTLIVAGLHFIWSLSRARPSLRLEVFGQPELRRVDFDFDWVRGSIERVDTPASGVAVLGLRIANNTADKPNTITSVSATVRRTKARLLDTGTATRTINKLIAPQMIEFTNGTWTARPQARIAPGEVVERSVVLRINKEPANKWAFRIVAKDAHGRRYKVHGKVPLTLSTTGPPKSHSASA